VFQLAEEHGRQLEDPLALSPEPDDVLIQRAQQDPAAFEPLYERYVAQIYAYCYYRVGNAQDAEDITARAFYQALTHLNRYTARGVPFSAWLFRIAHNLVANWHRDTGRRHSVSLDAAIDTPDPGRSLTDHAEGNEETHSLWEAIRRLPPERQQLLVLKFVDEMSTEQIAVIMGRSEGAVKALLHRTLVAMRGQLSDPVQGEHSQP
jgi:RNA polymerase sigma-70 factor, ECF subfamily